MIFLIADDYVNGEKSFIVSLKDNPTASCNIKTRVKGEFKLRIKNRSYRLLL